MENWVLFPQIPTFRANPLTPQCDSWCEFPVSDRPNAVAQFFKAAEADPSMIKVLPQLVGNLHQLLLSLEIL